MFCTYIINKYDCVIKDEMTEHTLYPYKSNLVYENDQWEILISNAP